MSGGQIAALIFALLLLLPGGCFLLFGFGNPTRGGGTCVSGCGGMDYEPGLLTIGAVILSLAGLLFWLAFRRRRPGRGGSTDAPLP